MELSRKNSLDGLRGISALVVVLHHLLLTLPWFADRVGLGLLGTKNHFTLSIHNLFEYTPLHVFFGGTEAVMIFFVLSGYVLINPISRDSIFTYARYRLLRLYAPIFVAVTLAAGLIIVFKRTALIGGSWWLNSHAVHFSFASYIKNLWVVEGSDWMDSSLWTMRYEVIFSLAVVVFAKYVFKKSIRTFALALVLICFLTWLGMHFGFDLMGWLPVFFAGSALHWMPEVRRAPVLRLFIGVVGLFLPWCFAGFGYSTSPVLNRVLMTIGAVMIVDICRQPGSWVARELSGRLPKLAGRYSYSLYLIHAPILTTVWFVMGEPVGHVAWLVRFAISLVCIAAGTAVVYQLGEKPSLRWIHNRKPLTA